MCPKFCCTTSVIIPSSLHHTITFFTHIKFHPHGKVVNSHFHLSSTFLLYFIHYVPILYCIFCPIFLYISCVTTLHVGKYDDTWKFISFTTLKCRYHILFLAFTVLSLVWPCHVIKLPHRKVAANTMKKHRWLGNSGWSSSFGVGWGISNFSP